MSKKVGSAMFFVLLAGLIWTFGPLIVRKINNAELIPWQYSLIRGSAIFLILSINLNYLVVRNFVFKGNEYVAPAKSRS